MAQMDQHPSGSVIQPTVLTAVHHNGLEIRPTIPTGQPHSRLATHFTTPMALPFKEWVIRHMGLTVQPAKKLVALLTAIEKPNTAFEMDAPKAGRPPI